MAPYTGEPTLEEKMENLVDRYAPGDKWWRAERRIISYHPLLGFLALVLGVAFVVMDVSLPFTGAWIIDEIILAGVVVCMPSVLLLFVVSLIAERRGTWVRYGIEDFVARYGGEVRQFAVAVVPERIDHPGAEFRIAVLENKHGAHAFVLFKTFDLLAYRPGADRDPEVALYIEDKEGQMQRLDVLHESPVVS